MSVIPVGFGEVFAKILLAGDNEVMGCVFGIDADTPFNQAEADAVSSATGTFLKAIMGSAYAYQGVTITIGNDGENFIFDSTTGLGNGALSATTAPQNTAMLIRKISATGGRRGRGRMYVPGIDEAFVSNAGVITAGQVTAINTHAATFLTNLVAANNPMVILHDVPEVTPSPVTGLLCQSLVATQRRRLR